MAPAKDVPKKGRSHAAPKAAQQDTLASIDCSKILTREIQCELKEQATAPKSAVAAALEVPTAAPRARERRQGVVLPSHRTFKAIDDAPLLERCHITTAPPTVTGGTRQAPETSHQSR